MDKIILIISSLLLVVTIIETAVLLIKKKNTSEKQEDVQDIIDRSQDVILREVNGFIMSTKDAIITSNSSVSSLSSQYMKNSTDMFQLMKEENTKNIKEMENQIKQTIVELKNDVSLGLDKMTSTNEKGLKDIQDSNERRLEDMRKTVNEQLSSTLNDSVSIAFKQINESLSSLQERLGAVNELSTKVDGLNKMFTNVKTRGNWGEIALESLLSQVLSPDQYEKQVAIKKNTKDNNMNVDFAVKMPGDGKGDYIYLPIDSKFPMTQYEALVQAIDMCDGEGIKKAKKELLASIKKEAKSISEKYINPPKTTDFAIMYLATEGLYAEVVKEPALVDELQNNFRVIPCGPTVIGALLNSLQIGFTTLKIQKGSKEIVDLLKSFRVEFTKLKEFVNSVRKNAEGVIKSIEDVDKRNEKISKCLRKIDEITIDEPKSIKLGIDTGTNEQ